MSDDIGVPKEKFLIDYFEKKKPKPQTDQERGQFGDILNKIQLKIDKKDLNSLTQMQPEEAEKKIESLNNQETISVVKETVDKLRSEKA